MNLRNLRWTAAATVLAAALATLPLSDARAEIKIGVVDFQQVMHDSSAGKAVQQAVQANDESFRKETTGRREKLQQTEQELVRQRSSLSAEAFAKKREDFLQKAGEFDRDVQAHIKALQQGMDEASRTIQAAAVEIINALAHERQTSMVVNKAQVIFVEPSLDMTSQVIEKLNAKLPSVQVKIPPDKK